MSQRDVMSGLYSQIKLRSRARQVNSHRDAIVDHRFRLLILMAQGPAGALPEAWRSFAQIEDAFASASEVLRNPQVLRVAIVEDGSGLIGSANPLRFVEWVG